MKSKSTLIALIVGCFAVANVVSAQSRGAEDGDRVACPEPPRMGKTDYRDRSTPQLRWNIDDNKWAHLDPARALMQQGDYSRRVMADLNWTLVRYPNHHLALELLITYVKGGGRAYEFQAPECYFQWATDFAPNDAKVFLAEGFFYWRMNNLPRAIKSYEAVFKFEPDSVSAHYNLGLLYLDMKNFALARQHAARAYELGYPLPGLRDKLKAAGYDVPQAPKDSGASAAPELKAESNRG